MNKKLAARILLIILILALAAISCVGGGGGEGGSGGSSGSGGEDSDVSPEADATATYGAEQFHIQLTAIAQPDQ
jgi:hypothetical protein